MIDPILYLSMFLSQGGIYVLIASFNDDDNDDEKYMFNLNFVNAGI